MGKKGEDTRELILNIAERTILERGYNGTSIDQIISEAKITKGGFFYHFSGKNELAAALLRRYLIEDEKFFNGLFERAESLTEDPLQQMLVFMKLLAENMAQLPDLHPGCLVASFTYERYQLDEDVRSLTAEGTLSWRRQFSERLGRIVAAHPAKTEICCDELADMLSSIIEGGIIVSRVLSDPDVLVNQLLQYRTYLRLLFGDIADTQRAA